MHHIEDNDAENEPMQLQTEVRSFPPLSISQQQE